MSVSDGITSGGVDATIHSGPNGERGVMCFLSADQLAKLGVSDGAENITYYVQDGSVVVEE